MSDETKVPAIPAVTEQNLREVALAIKQLVDVREGRLGNPLDANVTFRDLVDVGAVTVRPGWNSRSGGSPVMPTWYSADGYDPTADMTPPPAPAHASATGLFALVQLEWDRPDYRNHSYAEVWRSETDVIGNALLIGTSDTQFYVDSLGTSATRYYWVRFVSQANVKGPFQGVNGMKADTAKNPALLIESLKNQITATELHSTLGSRIDLIDAPATTANSVNARIAYVQGQVNDLMNIPAWSATESYVVNDQVTYSGSLYRALQASTNIIPTNATYWQKIGEYTSIGDAVAAHTTQINDLTTAVGQEVIDRNALAVQMRGNYAGNDLSLLSEGLLFQERTARASADSAVVTSVTNLTALVNTKTRVYYQTTAPVGTAEAPLRTGDIWVDTNVTYAQDYFASDYSIKSNRMYRWDGSTWVEAMDYGFADTFSAINIEQIARVNADSALSSQIQTLVSSVGANTAAIQTEAITRANADSALSTLVNNLSSTVNTNKQSADAALQTEATTRATADTALSQSITTLSSTVNTNNTTLDAAIKAEAKARADQDTVIASSITTLQTSIGDVSSALTTEATTRAEVDGGLLAQYTVKTDVNGYVSGYGLASTAKDAAATSTFAVRADTFYIANPEGPTIAPAMPFIVRTTSENIGGQAVGPGVYMTEAFIADGTIGRAKIANLAVDSAKIAEVDATKIKSGFIDAARIEAKSITADKIGGGQISASETITVGGTGLSAPLVLSGNGEIISNGTGGDKARFWSGNVEIYKNVPNVGSVIYKALSRVEVGVADNNTEVTIPGYFKSQPKIIVSPRNLMLFKASYSNQDQSVQCEARSISETSPGSMVWKFTGVATLSLAANTGTTVINQNSGSISTNWTSGEYTTASNTSAITPSVTMSSNRGNGVSQYYRRTVRWRLEYWNGSSWIADTTWTAVNIGDSTTNSVNSTKTFTFPSSGTWKFRIQFEAYDTDGTVFGSVAYEYATDTVSRTDDVSFTTSTSDSFPATGNYQPTYSIPSGWSVTGVSWTYHYTYELIGSYSSGGFGSYPSSGIAYLSMPGVSLSASYAFQGGYGAGYYGEYKSASNVAGSASTSSYAFPVSTSTSGTGASASVTMLDISAVVSRRKPIANSTTASNNFQLNSYAFELTSSQVLATGSLNWVALGE